MPPAISLPARAQPVAPAAPARSAQPGPRFSRLLLAIMVGLGILGVVFALGAGSAFVALGLAAVAIGGADLEAPILRHTDRAGGRAAVAIVPVDGVIDGGLASFIRSCADEVLADDSIKAVVLRVDSPGGGVTASDQIWYEVERLKKSGRPVIASYGSVAASGGYYVSCGCDFVMAEETCMTGSIGVIAQVMTFEGLLDKVGIEPVTLVASRSPDKSVANDTFRTWNDEDRAEVLGLLDAAYTTFNSRVHAGRGHVIQAPERIDELADGSVYTAAEALQHGLIDAIGYLDDAVKQAEQAAGLTIDGATIEVLSPRPTLFGLPFVSARAPRSADAFDADRVRSLVNDLSTVRLMYLTHLR
jgi:protease-4